MDRWSVLSSGYHANGWQLETDETWYDLSWFDLGILLFSGKYFGCVALYDIVKKEKKDHRSHKRYIGSNERNACALYLVPRQSTQMAFMTEIHAEEPCKFILKFIDSSFKFGIGHIDS